MGGFNSYPALSIQSPTDQMGKVLEMRGLLQQQQIQKQQLDLQKQKVADEQATTTAMKDWDGQDYDALAKGVLKNGGSAAAAQGVQQHGLGIKKQVSDIAAQDATTGSKNLETYIGKHKAIGDALLGIEDVPDEQLHDHAVSTIKDLADNGILDPAHAQQLTQAVGSIADPKQLRTQIDTVAKSSMGARAAAEQAKQAAELKKSQADASLAEFKVKGLQASPNDVHTTVAGLIPPDWPDKTLAVRTEARMNAARQQGDLEGMQRALASASEEVGAVQKETNPHVVAMKLALSTAEAKAKQAVADGDPNAAAQLLVSGTVAPSQLISSRKPEFAQKAFSAAAQLQPGWNAQKADADFKVAGSPGNVAFFGSAKSLTDKGGTLDQLAEAAKDIPQNQFPVFNTIEDVVKAAGGSGPIAKYASILLGVSDDYSKVMGGGQGSDTSRTQALHLVPANASPDARAGAIEGIRGAVGSQINSRIGNNSVLKQMYGQEMNQSSGTAKPPAGATHIVPGKDGHNHYTNAAGTVDYGIAP